MENKAIENWSVLLIDDDDEDDYVLARTMLSQAQGRRIHLEWAATYEQGLDLLNTNHYDVVLVDYDLGPRTGIDLIRECSTCGNVGPLILYTGRGSYEVDVEAMEAGATLYLTKSEVSALLLERSIRYAIERNKIEIELQEKTQLLEKARINTENDMNQAQQLFQPFIRFVGRSDYGGSGMGLAICQKIVERHGGSISAHSVPGEGSTFIIILPQK